MTDHPHTKNRADFREAVKVLLDNADNATDDAMLVRRSDVQAVLEWFGCPFCGGGRVREQDLGLDRGEALACDNCHRIMEPEYAPPTTWPHEPQAAERPVTKEKVIVGSHSQVPTSVPPENWCRDVAPIVKGDTGPVVCDRSKGHKFDHEGQDVDSQTYPRRVWREAQP